MTNDFLEGIKRPLTLEKDADNYLVKVVKEFIALIHREYGPYKNMMDNQLDGRPSYYYIS